MERKSYERDLKRCRTKDEVERVKMTRLGASLSTVKSISNNPNIPESAKLGNIMVEYAKMKAVAEVTVKFVQSGAYAKLPTDAEYAEAVKEMEQAKHPEQTDDREEQADSVEESEQNTENGTPTDTGTADISSGSRELPEDRIQRERINAKPDIEIESPEQRKVKQARAKAAYQHFDGDWEADVTANTAFFDTKG